ncbi:TRAP transporter substrate-binding protein [Alteribacillus bidgolensis]|uniref:Extracellular solute-binding protein, family 7 n=1 Tax=Alteribacillus bidgolensis TaxID=930129 RepID=A0A1G8I8L4_9BACI|nr:TRAP transporter substrate-binding protein [Alteribacillus bidgolensis]SDI15236.1 extracellular solute-binding protein, family 7 [Alteribacillus bidgolensis]
MKKYLMVSLAVVFLLAGCGEEESAGGSDETTGKSDDTVHLTFATTNDDSGITAAMREHFDERITELSDGSIEVEYFMGGQLGGENEQLSQMEAGEIDLGMGVLHADSYYPEYNAINVPFLFKDFEAMQKFIDDDMRQQINEKAIEEGGIRTLGMQSYGGRWVTSNKPFSNPEELEGLKIRMPEFETWVPVFEELGALPTPISASEIVSALQTGTVDLPRKYT